MGTGCLFKAVNYLMSLMKSCCSYSNRRLCLIAWSPAGACPFFILKSCARDSIFVLADELAGLCSALV